MLVSILLMYSFSFSLCVVSHLPCVYCSPYSRVKSVVYLNAVLCQTNMPNNSHRQIISFLQFHPQGKFQLFSWWWSGNWRHFTRLHDSNFLIHFPVSLLYTFLPRSAHIPVISSRACQELQCVLKLSLLDSYQRIVYVVKRKAL